jgi:hypothetical protein
MTAVATSAQLGRIVPGELDVIFTPRGGCHGKRPVFLFHGQLRTAADWTDTAAWPGSAALANAIAASGLLVIAAYWSGPAWGNAAFRAEVETARTVAASLGAAADKFTVAGASMGAFESLSLAQHVPGEVACGVCTIPAVNLGYFRDNNVASAQGYINTAFGLPAGSTAATDPLPADADPFVPANSAQITAPFRFYGSSGDTTAPWADAVTLAGRIGASAQDVAPAGGHTDLTIGAAPVDEVVAFIRSHS